MSAGKLTIAMVDDTLTTLTIGQSALGEHYDVVTFGCGAYFMKMLQHKIPSLVLLDIDMPDINGFEIITYLKNDKRLAGIPVIFLTKHNERESELQGLSLGAVDYIIKPVSPTILLKRVEVALLVKSQKEELVRFNENLQKMVDEKTRSVIELKNAVLSAMAELVEFRDATTGGHISRTQRYLRVLIEAIQESGVYEDEIYLWDIDLIVQSAQLHDVGKIAVDDCILRKPGKLTVEEFEEIRRHPLIGEQIIERMKSSTAEHDFLEYAGIMAASHHEKWDGTGYCRGLKGKEIPLQSRLMAIADVYDALVSERPYKNKLSHKEAVEVIKSESGTHFEPILVEQFLRVAGKFQAIGIEGYN